MKFWQKGLKSYKLLYGISGEKGAQMELEYQMGKRNMVLIETITENKFPAKFHADYDTKGVHNIQKSIFHELDENTTRWESNCEYHFSGFGIKLMPFAFKKQLKKYLVDFKNFAEKGIFVENN
ncbi:SRPBCC family protein [Candidatus Marifrigoribacter sp. Uisw_064]|jgi:hypothetical protein|uniref:SRPBCC family protein n=1 Tax=Candidatus Marifrigoribacter sp. Uisw_064 TaxID=3230970 RepID=UPI003AE2FC4F